MTLRHDILAYHSKRGLNAYDMALAADISHGAFRLWHLILKFRDKDTGVAWSCPDVKAICSILKCTPESFGRWRKELERARLLEVENIYGPTRKRWRYTILDGAGENSARASLYLVRYSPSTGGRSRPSSQPETTSLMGGKCPPQESAYADCDGGQKPPPSYPLNREDGGASPALPIVRACERRPEDTLDIAPPADDNREQARDGSVSMFEIMRRAIE